MKKIGLSLLYFLLTFFVYSQQNWLKTIGSLTNEEILDASKTTTGDIVSVGYLSGNLNVGVNSLQTNGNSDVLVIKTDVSGNVIWAINAGGQGADRATSVTVDNTGNIYITGYFYNSATFGNITVTGQDRDVFVAKLDAFGNFIWVQSFGGQYGDTGYGIEVDNSGNVFCTGQYKGTGVFGSTLLNSMINPSNGLPSYDVFVTKLDALGNFLWTKDGKAKYDDRGLALAIDNSGNCYLTIEYSDTITFQNQYNNTAYNIGMILSFDNNGNELWSTNFSAGQVLINDIKWSSNQLYITGDFRGNLTINDINSVETFLSQHSYNIFTTQFSDNGDLIWLSTNFSSNELYAKQLTLDVNDDIYVVGLFKCAYDEMNQLYGNSTFLSLGYRDIHYMKYNNAGEFQWSRQVGSNKDDYCASIIIQNTDFPILIGSSRNSLNVPYGNNFANDINTNTIPYSILSCGNNIVEGVVFNNHIGYYDIFYTSPFDVDRIPLDYYAHLSNHCSTDTVPPCINNCEDTITFCYDPLGYEINVNHFQNIISPTVTTPLYNYLWSNGQTTQTNTFYQQAYTYQDFNVHISRQDDCWEWYDTATVYIDPVPSPPLITDSWGYNTSQPPSTNPINTCLADTLFITATSNNTASVTVNWINGNYYNDSTIYTLSSGIFSTQSINNYGCISHNQINVSIDDFALHDTLAPSIHFYNTILENTDSIYTCTPFQFKAFIIDTNYILPNGETPYKSTLWYLDGVFLDSIYHYNPFNLYGETSLISILTSGWHNLSAHLINECGDTVDYFFDRNFYVDLLPSPQLVLTTPNQIVCINDTVMIYAQHNADTVIWVGNNIINNFGDSIQVVATNYVNSFIATVDTTSNGLTCDFSQHIEIHTPPQPEIVMDPINGIVCPNDSVLLTALSGVAWQWVAPNGDFLGTNQTQYVNLPGFYHCIVTTVEGCVITSNFVEVKEYTSPFLVLDPPVFCTGDSTKIEVFSPEGTIINWLNPINDTTNIVYVDSAGTYYCETSFCNITTIDSVIVMESNPSVNLNFSGDSLICPIDEVLIMATPGYVVYNWNSGDDNNTLSTSDSGYYYVQIEDIYGCSAQSDTVHIGYLSNPQPPILSDTSVCLGSDLILITNNQDSTNWYFNNVLISTSDTLYVSNIDTTLIYFVTSSDSLCESASNSIIISIYESSVASVIYGDTVVCEGDSLTLFINPTDTSIVHNWITPNGNLNGNQIHFNAITLQDSGLYYLYNSDMFCSSDTTEFYLIVNPLPQVDLSYTNDTIMCPLDSISLTAITNADYFAWSDGNDDTTIYFYDTISYSYYAELNGCYAYSDTVSVSYYPYTQYSDTLYEQICQGDSILFNIDTNFSVIWIDFMNFDTVSYSNNFNTGALDYSVQYDVILQDGNLCPIMWYATADVIPTNYYPVIIANDVYCIDDVIQVQTELDSNTIFSQLIWVINGDTLTSANDLNLISTTDTIYNISLTENNQGCLSYTSTLDIEITPNPQVIITTSDTSICINDILVVTPYDSVSVFSEIISNPNSNFDSLFIYTLTDQNGCVTQDSVNITYIDCSLNAPNVFTPDGDGINDVYYFEVVNGEVLHITILNRWGDIVYETDDNKWNGKNKADKMVVGGTYYYIVEYKLFDETIKTKQGMVQVIK